ncbi:ATP-binding protein [Kiloniella laminariae]|uniref:ATP-binding protein n=1 Tax=Kiloniella laminariae TaxID=454162 RepID=A0ABT4LMH0_9PROT|nr:ATP-binding protein [Kiloniella laminariae]MCZ4282287.1 ATP-binding protein [Kiloniella laminariae]
MGSQRILLLDHDEKTHCDVSQILGEKNLQVVTAECPDEVIFDSLAETSPVSLILVSDDFDRETLMASSLSGGGNEKLKQKIPIIVMSRQGKRKPAFERLLGSCFHIIYKPLVPQNLCSAVMAGLEQYSNVRDLLLQLERRSSAIGLITSGTFEFRSPEQARNLTTMLAIASPSAERVVIGLSELLQNAIEHGNLEIGYALKTELLRKGNLPEEIEKRLATAPYKDRLVTLSFERREKEVIFIVTDEGAGFDWRKYLSLDDERLAESHGRGIAFASMMAFSELDYNEKGNQVTARMEI